MTPRYELVHIAPLPIAGATDDESAAAAAEIAMTEGQVGSWSVLQGEWAVVRREGDSLVIVGEFDVQRTVARVR